MGTISTALRFISSLLSLPIISLLRLAFRAVLSSIVLRTVDPPSPDVPPNSPPPNHHLKSRLYKSLKVSRYTDAHPVECAICLCDVDRGDEVRDLGCSHQFHVRCLDGWVGHGWSTCPLCRKSLVPAKVDEAGQDGYDCFDEDLDEDELSAPGLLYMVCLGRGGW